MASPIPVAGTTHPATLPHGTVAPGTSDDQQVSDDLTAARLTAIRIRGQHAELDGEQLPS